MKLELNRSFRHGNRFMHGIVFAVAIISLGGGLATQVAAQGKAADVDSKATAPFPVGKLIDLTHPFNEKTIYWPTADAFRLTVVAAGRTDVLAFYNKGWQPWPDCGCVDPLRRAPVTWDRSSKGSITRTWQPRKSRRVVGTHAAPAGGPLRSSMGPLLEKVKKRYC